MLLLFQKWSLALSMALLLFGVHILRFTLLTAWHDFSSIFIALVLISVAGELEFFPNWLWVRGGQCIWTWCCLLASVQSVEAQLSLEVGNTWFSLKGDPSWHLGQRFIIFLTIYYHFQSYKMLSRFYILQEWDAIMWCCSLGNIHFLLPFILLSIRRKSGYIPDWSAVNHRAQRDRQPLTLS